MPRVDPQARRAWEREYRLRPEVRERRKATARAWHAAKRAEGDEQYRERIHGYYVKWRYGITAEEYKRRLAEQESRCAICRTDDPSPRERFSVDHDHATGAVRGLLCWNCNIALGAAKDNVATLAAAIEYLEARR